MWHTSCALMTGVQTGALPFCELPFGNRVDMAEDGKGLWGKAQIDLDDPVGQRVHKALKRKSVRSLSIGDETIERKTDPKRPGINLLEELELWEVGRAHV